LRRIPLLVAVFAFGLAGAAYAATAIQNVYVLSPKTKVTPVKSGTKQHPVPIGSTFEFTTKTIPAGNRPNLVKTIQFTLQGIQAHTNDFKACSTSRLNDTAEGPSTCPKGSLVGTGHFIAEIGPTGNQSMNLLTCRAELSVYNGGNNTLSFYVYETKGAAGECPSTTPIAFSGTINQTKSGLVETLQIPAAVRHPIPNTDVAAIDTVVTVPAKQTTVNKKKVGLFESISCPANHQRQVAAKFTLEDGRSSSPVTRLVRCK
jgi:hypothetical protein